jgi:hypothetical protein
MARIPDAEIERLKAEVSLARLVESAGIKLEKRGADLVLRFHETDQLWGIPDAAPHVVSTRAAT